MKNGNAVLLLQIIQIWGNWEHDKSYLIMLITERGDYFKNAMIRGKLNRKAGKGIIPLASPANITKII